MMLVHIKQAEVAACIHNAWLATLEEGIHTADLHSTNSQRLVSTNEFAEAVIQHDLIKLLSVLTELGLDVIKIENLFSFK